MAFGAHFGDFGSLLGSLLETILVTLGVPFLHRFSEGFQDSPKVRVRLEWVVIWAVSGVQLTSLQKQNSLPIDSRSANQLNT